MIIEIDGKNKTLVEMILNANGIAFKSFIGATTAHYYSEAEVAIQSMFNEKTLGKYFFNIFVKTTEKELDYIFRDIAEEGINRDYTLDFDDISEMVADRGLGLIFEKMIETDKKFLKISYVDQDGEPFDIDTLCADKKRFVISSIAEFLLKSFALNELPQYPTGFDINAIHVNFNNYDNPITLVEWEGK